jgi:hypothetical protein
MSRLAVAVIGRMQISRRQKWSDPGFPAKVV